LRPDKEVRKALVLAKAITPNPGGIETYSEQVAKAYADFGFEVTVISCFHGKRGRLKRGALTVVNVGMQRQWLVAIRMLSAVMSYRLRSGPPTLVHATTWRVALPAIIAFRRCPLAITIHGREVTATSGWKVFLMRYIFAKARKALAISQSSLAAAAQRVPALQQKAVVSWNGITACPEDAYLAAVRRRSNNKVCRILTICRLVPRKNVAAVLRALAIISEQGYSGWEYSIVGDGPEIDDLTKVREECGLSGKVGFLGRVSNREIEEAYSSCDVFAHPQVTDDTGRDIEGFGLVIADAMAWGLPVIVGRDGGPGEFVLHGETGYVVDGYDIGELAEKLKLLVEDSERRRSMGIAARAWAIDNLAWSKHIAPVVGPQKSPGGSHVVDR